MFGPPPYRNRKLPALPPRPEPTVPPEASTHLDMTIKLPPIALSGSASTGQPGESVCFYRSSQCIDITRSTDTLTLPSLASVGLPRQLREQCAKQDSSSITLSYWPEADVEDDTYTVRADDELTKHTCAITIDWTDGVVEPDALTIPSGKRLIDTQGRLRNEVESQLAGSERLREMRWDELRTFHRVLWLKYRNATVKSVTIPTRVVSLARGGDSSAEGQLVEIVLPSGYSYRPDGLVKGFIQHLERMGYALISVEEFRLAYVTTCQQQRERYRGLADEGLVRKIMPSKG
jgi:hypothetical protein